MNTRQLFLSHIGQTTQMPLCFEIESARGYHLYDEEKRSYIDAIGGISVANVGHSHPKVVQAIQDQSQKYLHTMVYGEMVQSPQVRYAQKLVAHLHPTLNNVYFTSSGAEAIEGAMKLVKKATGRSQIFCFNQSYHGSTQGALSMIGSEYWRQAFRPLLPGILHYDYNDRLVIEELHDDVAAVFIEPVQAESGVVPAGYTWLNELAKRCNELGILLVMDESQSGFGRTGKLWAYEHYDVVPDILVLAKAIGGGLPLGAFIADKELMMHLTDAPILGHISTFGGHPLSCAAGLAAFEVLIEEVMPTLDAKIGYMQERLSRYSHANSCGLWAALFHKDFDQNKKIVDACISEGVFTDWFLFASHALRLSPPLIIDEKGIDKIFDVIDRVSK